jgi:precorrin-2 methylase
VVKEYVVNNSFIKYLGVPMWSRKMSKTKFLEANVQKVFEELDKKNSVVWV